ncbi:hypothetical protein CAL7716_072380 [Calothrix sp. PCC 7716]|nr:hypothetical protein CAL7716_072380 [Calothrix sp. PCC 7716]
MTEEEKRLLRIERYINAIKFHLHQHNLLLQELADDYAHVKCENPEENSLCIRIKKERESLKTLRDLVSRF